MRGVSLSVLVPALLLAMSGCVSISKYTPPETQIGQDRPLIMGKIGNQDPKIQVGIELLEIPDFSRLADPKTPDDEITGNGGNMEGGVFNPRNY